MFTVQRYSEDAGSARTAAPNMGIIERIQQRALAKKKQQEEEQARAQQEQQARAQAEQTAAAESEDEQPAEEVHETPAVTSSDESDGEPAFPDIMPPTAPETAKASAPLPFWFENAVQVDPDVSHSRPLASCLSPELVSALTDKGITSLFPVQAAGLLALLSL